MRKSQVGSNLMREVRGGLILFFLLVVCDGALRKWLFPGQQAALFIAKDVVLGATLMLYLLRKRFHLPLPIRHSALGILLSFYACWCLLQAFNLSLPNPILGLFGFKLHVLYASLIVIIPAAFQSFERLYAYIKKYIIISIPVLALGIAQFYSPRSSIINKYVAQGLEGSNVAGFGQANEFARITGTFSYISGMQEYTFFVTIIAICIAIAARNKFSASTILIYLVVILGGIVTPMNGSRWPIFAWGITIAVFLFMIGRTNVMKSRVQFFVQFAVVILIAVFAVLQFSQEATTALEERIDRAGDSEKRIGERFTEPLDFFTHAGLFGYGAGSTYQAASVLTDAPKSSWAPPIYFEAGPGRIALELGLIGFMLYTFLLMGLSLFAYKTALQALDLRRFLLCTAALAFIATHATEQISFNPTTNAYFWGLCGVVAKIACDVYARQRA